MQSRRLLERTEALLKRERGTVFKDPGGRVNICLVYPNTYHVGMSNLAFQGLYGLINSRDDALAERAFLPEDEDVAEYERMGCSLFSLESKRPLREFHAVAFSVSFENDYPNIVKILKLAGIPAASAHRDETHPVVIGGGVALTANPEPVADIFDAIFIGEAEDAMGEIIDAFKRATSREQLLRELVFIEGMYVPEAYAVQYRQDGRIDSFKPRWQEADFKIKKRTIMSLTHSFRHSIITDETEFSKMVLVEAMRGCPWRCGFCLAGHIYWPVRHKPFEVVRAEAGNSKRVGLIGPSLTEYRYIKEALCEGFELSVTSLRASKRISEMLELVRGQRSVSIAPESSERIRKALGKELSNEEIIEACREILRTGPKSLRCYFMVGLPEETEEDIEEIIRLVKEIRALSKKGKVVVSVSVFVPKPHTPLQWVRMQKEEVVKERLKRLKKTFASVKGVEFFSEVPKYAYLQGLLSRGDRRLSTFLLQMQNVAQWRKELQRHGLGEEFYLYRQRSSDEILPWDFIETGFSKQQLWQRYEQILERLKAPEERHI